MKTNAPDTTRHCAYCGNTVTEEASAPERFGERFFEHVHTLAFDAAGRALWLGAHTGLYRSDDGGRRWSKVAVPAQGHDPDVMAVIGHPNAASVVYVGTHEAGVLKTTDGGETWVAVNT